MPKIVINRCYGGFSLSEQAQAYLSAVYRIDGSDRDIPRDSLALVATVEKLGKAANGMCAALHVVEIPSSVKWVIEEYDGNEWVAEQHRTWR